MKDIVDTLLQRTSVRRYEMQPIEPEKRALIYNAIGCSPTSYNGQQYSVIAIDDQQLKEGMSYHTLGYYNEQGYGILEEYDV